MLSLTEVASSTRLVESLGGAGGRDVGFADGAGRELSPEHRGLEIDETDGSSCSSSRRPTRLGMRWLVTARSGEWAESSASLSNRGPASNWTG